MILLTGSLVFLTVVIAIHFFIKLAPEMKLLAEPGGHRHHDTATPMVGGIGIYLGLLVGMVLIDGSFVTLMPSLFLLCAVGVLDDRYSLPSWSRFLVQGVAAYLMIEFTGAHLSSLGNLVSPEHEVLLGRWSTPVTIFAAIGVINAVNMSDGMDGLAGCMLTLVFIALSSLGGADNGLVMVAMISVGGFLFWNLRIFRSNAAVFMGDAGSTMLGLLIAYLLINSSQIESAISPVTALWLLALPLMDAVAVLLVRPLRGKSPFLADRIHYHHQLAEQGFSVNGVLVVSLALQMTLILAGFLMWHVQVPDHLQLILFLILFLCYFGRLLWYTRVSK